MIKIAFCVFCWLRLVVINELIHNWEEDVLLYMRGNKNGAR